MSAILSLLLFVGAWAAWVYVKHKVQDVRTTRKEHRRIRAVGRAKTRRPPTQRVLSLLPAAWVQRIFAWKQRKPRPYAVVAKTGPLGRPVRVNPAQHILAVGMTGSGKSSTLRVLAAWALLRPDWTVEAWDGKWGASAAPYRGRARILADLDAIIDRLHDLVTRELPARALLVDRPHLAVILDETRLIRMLPDAALKDLITAIETGRELGVHFWFGVQDPKTDVIPSAVRDQFTLKLAHRLQNSEAAQVVFKDATASGWTPHLLSGPGQLYVWEALRRPVVSYGLWLSPAGLTALDAAGPLSVLTPPVTLAKAGVGACVRQGSAGQAGAHTPTRTPARPLTDAQALALSALGEADALTAAQLARELGTDRFRARDVLNQLTAKGLVARTETGAYALTTAADAVGAHTDEED